MAPSATSPAAEASSNTEDATILTLRKTLCTESAPLATRFRALFSLKHLACTALPNASDPNPSPPRTALPAINAIAAAFASPSALLKHELAYCLGQTRNLAAVPFLRQVLEDIQEDPMCRHEAAEALGALGDEGSLDVLRLYRDKAGENKSVKETCEIAVERIEWENSAERKKELLRTR